jgi:putative membrane protein
VGFQSQWNVLTALELWLPLVNAALIVISGIFLIIGYLCIRSRKIVWHRRSMLTASAFAALFLIVYVSRFLLLGSKVYPGDGISRAVYLVILVSHIIIAIAVAPLAVITLRRALAGRFALHRKIARVTVPLWIYAAVTGWVVYMLLYVLS